MAHCLAGGHCSVQGPPLNKTIIDFFPRGPVYTWQHGSYPTEKVLLAYLQFNFSVS